MVQAWFIILALTFFHHVSGDQTLAVPVGALSFTVTRPADAGIWRITIPSVPLKRVHFCIDELNINSAELQIYDLEDYQMGRAAVFDCISCGRNIPPMFSTRTGVVIILIKGVIGVTFIQSSFRLTYIAEPASLTNVNTNYANIALNYNMGYAKIFPLTVEDKLPPSSRTTWNIAASSKITFSFDTFGAGSADCRAVLTLYDGPTDKSPVIFNGSISDGLPSDWRYSTTGRVLATLKNQPTLSACSFEVSYYADMNLYRCGSLFQPDIVKSKSMILSDGSAISNNMRRGKSCFWRMLAGEDAPVYNRHYSSQQSSTGVADETARLTLLFPWVELKTGGAVTVYDNDVADGTVLWQSEGTNTVVPPPLRSTGRSLYIAYTSNSQLSTGFRGFRGEYLTQTVGSRGVGSRIEIYAMSSALDITPPGYSCFSKDCVYTSGVNYGYLIKPQSIATNARISFMFSSIDLKAVGDSLTIFDGIDTTAPILSRWVGSATPQALPNQWVNSTGQTAYVEFISLPDSSNSGVFKYGGFKFSYYSDGPNYHCGFSVNPATVLLRSHVFSDGSASAASVFPNQDCQWRVSPVGNSGGITLLFHRMDLNDGGALIVYSEAADGGKEIYTVISNTRAVPAPITVPHNMYMSYKTTSSVSGKGFLVSYFSSQGINTQAGSIDGRIFLFCTSITKLILPPASIVIGSSLYEPGWSATWEIRPTTNKGPLFVSLNELNFPDDCSDYLALYSNKISSRELVWTSCANPTIVPRSSPSTVIARHDSEWVSLPNADVSLSFVSSNKSKGNSSFDISYVTDGSNFHCGFARNPAILIAPSFVFTDGSDSSESMYPNQDCEWLVQPKANMSDSTLVGKRVVVFLNVHFTDMKGARLQVYDGDGLDGVLLWDCNGCSYTPPQFASEYGSFFIKFTSSGSSEMGSGFRLYYYSLAAAAIDWSERIRDDIERDCSRSGDISISSCEMSAQVLLEQPYNFQFDNSVNSVLELDVSGNYWLLDYPGRLELGNAGKQPLQVSYTRPAGVLSFWPSSPFQRTSATPVGNAKAFSDLIRSGRVGNVLTKQSALFTPSSRDGRRKDRYYCGTWHVETPLEDLRAVQGVYDSNRYSRAERSSTFVARSPLLADRMNRFEFRPSQVTGVTSAYVASPNVWLPGQEDLLTEPDALYSFVNDVDSSRTAAFQGAVFDAQYDIPYPASVCKYAINTAPGVPIPVRGNGKGSGGYPVTFRILKTTCTSSSPKRLRIFGGIYGNDTLLYDSSGVLGVPSGTSTVVAFCGRAIVLLDNVNGVHLEAGETNTSEICGFEIDYTVDFSGQPSSACNNYIDSIFYVPPEPLNYMQYVISAVMVIAVLLLLCICVIYVPPLILLTQEKYKAYDRYGLQGLRRNVKTTSLHPRFTPKLDQWKNNFLQKGMCCVCKDGPFPVFKLNCGHQLCTDDLRGYIETALGDVSMFPVKCPMHYDGCNGQVGSDLAKRVVTKSQYSRFIDFVDRSLFGDGIRCIFCENFVIYPSNSKVSMVTCPYCVQIFCMRCLQPWHYGAAKCPLEKAEDECLETWKAISGAQRCPACRKLIEKDDPDTCHHMVHRASDGIPCIRDRTDFCYLCGIEVAADYPHDEINTDNTGVNHFPDGVFQKCRTIINREKAEEREKLRKSKRLRKSPTKKFGYSSNFVLPSEWDTDTASTPGGRSNDIELVGGPVFSEANTLSDDAALAAELGRQETGNRFEAEFDAPWEEATRVHPASPVRTNRRQPSHRRR